MGKSTLKADCKQNDSLQQDSDGNNLESIIEHGPGGKQDVEIDTKLHRIYLRDALQPVVELERYIPEAKLVKQRKPRVQKKKNPVSESKINEIQVNEEERLSRKKKSKNNDLHSKKIAVQTTTCQICDQNVKTKALKQHILLEHAGIPCSLCDEVFTSAADKVRHLLRDHRNEKKLFCDLCPEWRHSKLGMEKHLWHHISRRSYSKFRTCKLCTFKTINNDLFIRHKQAHRLSRS